MSAGLKQRLHDDLTTAMKARDELRTASLRMALTALTNEEVAGKQARELSDEDVVAVLRREVKKRTEAAEAFAGGGREASADRERAEREVLAAYLPAEMSEADLNELVEAAVAESGATTPGQMGQVMKLLTPKVAGRAEGGRVAAAVRQRLAQSAP
ncbi:MAG: uncharacterized protein QOG52_664 [Frankiaceae bacterium]|nr:uncharacterized protein [Frankiaceae bacterium]